MNDFERVYGIIENAVKANIISKITFSRPENKAETKVIAKPFLKNGEVMYQMETLTTDKKAIHQNISVQETASKFSQMACREYGQTNIVTTGGICEILKSKKGSIHINNKISDAHTAQIGTHNKQKNYIIDSYEHKDFLSLLGVCDNNGNVFDKKRAKFRQINRFLELIDDVYEKLPDGELCICDLCCGKSYLTFAVYYYFTNIRQRKIKMYGVDLKADVIDYCKGVAEKLNCNGLEFVCEDIMQFDPCGQVDMVISLHACDIATDIVLAYAIKHKAKAVLSTPCCHHEMMKQIDCTELDFIEKHSILKQKLCDAATDALRALRLEAAGYNVEALELIDPEETPKNVMIRACLVPSDNIVRRNAAYKKYIEAAAFLGVTPYLENLLQSEKTER